MNRRASGYSLALMVFCLLVAAALRFPDLQVIPPGLHYDEAANGILAGDIGLRGERPVFISSYTGKEALFFYAAGSVMRVVGESVFSLRLTAAFAGILTVAATYWLGREMLADRRQALLAAALLAVSFWHVLFSRLGFRAITEPLFQAVAIAALFRGLRREDSWWLAGSGVLFGLTAYTYLAARVFPILVGLGLLPLIVGSDRWRLRRRQVGIFLAAAAVTILPLLGYFWANPDAFWVRIGQVAPSADQGPALLAVWSTLLDSWAMFFLRGDPFLRFNLPGRPLFGWLTGGLLVAGWIICLWRWRRFPYDWQRAAISMLVFTPLIMILPTALATNELVPSNLRAIGLIPFIFYLPAIGFVALFADLERRFGFPPLPASVIVAAMFILLSGGLSTAQAYFGQWAREPDLLYETDGDLSAVAGFLDQQAGLARTVYVAAPHYRHPTVAFLSDEYEAIKWLPQSEALVLPAEGSSLYVYPHNSPRPAWAAEILAEAKQLSAPQTRFPENAFQAYLLETPPVIDVANRIGANFAGMVTLLGYELAAPVQSGRDLALSLVWRVDRVPDAAYLPFVHLEDTYGHRWSQQEAFAYPAEQWQTGETIIQQVIVPVPPGTPPGTYRLRIGMFDRETGQRAAKLDAGGNYAGDAVLVDGVSILPGPVPRTPPQAPFALGDEAAPGLAILGYERGPLSIFAGEEWGFALWWLASQPVMPLAIQLELVDEAGLARALPEAAPVYDSYPFELWQAPQFIIDRQSVEIPVDFPPGDYRLRLRLRDQGGEILYTADLGPLQVEATERIYAAPTLEHEVNALFGDEILLLGYDLGPLQNGRADLTLVWQALNTPSAGYTVFVHVLYPDGTCCVWQEDSVPQAGRYSTERWLQGEVVIDGYEIVLPSDLPAGEYPIEVGLYVAETGQRLGMRAADGRSGDAAQVRPLTLP